LRFRSWAGAGFRCTNCGPLLRAVGRVVFPKSIFLPQCTSINSIRRWTT